MTHTPAAGGNSQRLRTKPRYKGYIRSGQLLNNNINQINTWDSQLTKATTKYLENRKASVNSMLQKPKPGADKKPGTAYNLWVEINDKAAGSRLNT